MAENFDVVITDIKMPDRDGLWFLQMIRKEYPETAVIMMTGYASVDYAVQTLKLGAYDFVRKPFDPDDLARLVEKAIEHRSLVAENVGLKRTISETSQFTDIVG